MRKRALITGASRGIGKEIAGVLAREGYDLCLVCRHSKDALEEVKAELEKAYDINVGTWILDVSDSAAVEKMIKETGEIHVLINNAAISKVGLLTDMSIAEWQQVMDINLNALFYTCRLIVPQMVRRQEGKIINISSVWGNVGASMEVAYSTAKGGVNSFTKALAKELAPSNIQVNAVAFGMIDTDMNTCFSAEEIEELKAEIPADRLGTAREAAEMVFKIIDAPAYLTGQIVTMDGGWI